MICPFCHGTGESMPFSGESLGPCAGCDGTGQIEEDEPEPRCPFCNDPINPYPRGSAAYHSWNIVRHANPENPHGR